MVLPATLDANRGCVKLGFCFNQFECLVVGVDKPVLILDLHFCHVVHHVGELTKNDIFANYQGCAEGDGEFL